MKDLIEQYEQEVTDILQTRERKKAEYAKFKDEKRAEIDELTSLIDDALSEDNLQKVEELTIRKTGLETFLRTLEERNAAIDSPAQRKKYEERGVEVYHGLVYALKEADAKDLEKVKNLLAEAERLTLAGAQRRNRAQSVMTNWTTKISTVNGASSVGIDTELNDIYNRIKNVMR